MYNILGYGAKSFFFLFSSNEQIFNEHFLEQSNGPGTADKMMSKTGTVLVLMEDLGLSNRGRILNRKRK